MVIKLGNLTAAEIDSAVPWRAPADASLHASILQQVPNTISTHLTACLRVALGIQLKETPGMWVRMAVAV